jgi:hypothetical protein
MSRPLRIEFPGAHYHATARGDRRKRIYIDAFDYRAWLDVLSFVCVRHLMKEREAGKIMISGVLYMHDAKRWTQPALLAAKPQATKR